MEKCGEFERFINMYSEVIEKYGNEVLKEIEGPEMEIYVAKDDVELGDYVHVDIDKDKVNKVDVPYRNLLLEMARMVGLEDNGNK